MQWTIEMSLVVKDPGETSQEGHLQALFPEGVDPEEWAPLSYTNIWGGLVINLWKDNYEFTSKTWDRDVLCGDTPMDFEDEVWNHLKEVFPKVMELADYNSFMALPTDPDVAKLAWGKE